jgi:hypothetical protein
MPGAQKLTVLALWRHWALLPNWANLRHVPRRAQYTLVAHRLSGILHFAGKLKPHALCALARSRTALVPSTNWQRLESFRPYARVVHELRESAAEADGRAGRQRTFVLSPMTSEWLERCGRCLPDVSSLHKFLQVVAAFGVAQSKRPQQVDWKHNVFCVCVRLSLYT